MTPPDPIADALVALVRKYPGALTLMDAVRFLAAVRGETQYDVHIATDRAMEHGPVRFGDRWLLTLPGAVPNPRRPPLPLTSPDGRVFGWACAHCLDVGSIPGVRAETRDVERAAKAESSLYMAELCGSCRRCGAFDPAHAYDGNDCAACEAKHEASLPKGAWVPCAACDGSGKVEALMSGASVVVECPICDGDRQLWEAET